MNKLSIFLTFCIVAVSAGCATQPSITGNLENQTSVLSKKEVNAEKPVTKKAVSSKEANFKDSDFSKLADKTANNYKSDDIFNKAQKNGVFDYLPYRTYSDFENDLKLTNYTSYLFLNSPNGNRHFNKNYSAYQYASDIYKANANEMKRFIAIDVLANCIEIRYNALPYSETHNPPFSHGFKLLPTQAAFLMPTFGEIMEYNSNNTNAPFVKWDMNRAATFYQSNYRRYMGLVMEHGPSDKYKVYDYIHREISNYAGY